MVEDNVFYAKVHSTVRTTPEPSEETPEPEESVTPRDPETPRADAINGLIRQFEKPRRKHN